MIRARYDSDLTGIPLDRSTPFFLYKIGVGFKNCREVSRGFGTSFSSNWKGFGSSHSWKKMAFRHVGSIFGRSPERNISLIVQ